jgi:hypothetical protein
VCYTDNNYEKIQKPQEEMTVKQSLSFARRLAALVLALYWGATLLYLPATILTILAFGFWLPITIALMIVYPGLEKVFKLEETINARRAAEIEERMAQNQPKFDQ